MNQLDVTPHTLRRILRRITTWSGVFALGVASTCFSAYAAKPSIQSFSCASRAEEGSNVSITVSALVISSQVNASGALATYSLWKDGTMVSMTSYTNRQTSHTFRLSNISASAAGNYKVRVSNPDGYTDSSSKKLEVYPKITVHPSSCSVEEGGSAQLVVTAISSLPISYTWLKNGSSVGQGSSYTISNAKQSDAGSYTVRLDTSAGSVTSRSATVTVRSKPDPQPDPDPFGGSSGNGDNEYHLQTPLKSHYYNTSIDELKSCVANNEEPAWIEEMDVVDYGINNEWCSDYLAGWLIAPESGTYVIWFFCDYTGEFWLSSDASKAGIGSSPLILGDFYEVRSAKVKLQAGQWYYFEIYHDSDGVPNRTVLSWVLPSEGADGVTETTLDMYSIPDPIEARYLSGVLRATTSSITIATQPQSQTVTEGTSVTFSVKAEDAGGSDPDVSIELARCPAGIFTMGSPGNELGRTSDDEAQHQVTISKDFWMGKYEVTQAQYQTIMGKNPSGFINKTNNYPVENVSWNEAMDFCARLTAIERRAGRLPEGYEYTLPTEEQWEYACRADTTTAFNNGGVIPSKDQIRDVGCPNLDNIACYYWKYWSFYNSPTSWGSGYTQRTSHQSVGEEKPNKWNLYDMHGNVAEWCLNYTVRGGGWNSYAGDVRSASRVPSFPGNRSNSIGFRVALVPSTSSGQGATPTDNLTYQWYKNGQAISGATKSSYIISSAKTSDAGNYNVVVSNGTASTTSGTAVLTVIPNISYHPADTDKDQLIKIEEVTAYGKAWKNGGTWSVAPNPIPIEYLTRAGALWKNGESYTQDKTQEAPLCWVNGGSAQVLTMSYTPMELEDSMSVIPEVEVEAAAGSLAVCTITGEEVTITVTPASGTSVYAVEDGIPNGWTVTGINENGSFDETNGKVKWGPWFDSSPRTLTYTLVVPSGFSGTVTLNGKASFDGVNMTITGDRQYTKSPDPIPPTITTQPESQTVTEGSSVTFSVTASGTAPLSYQWKKNGSNISGATSSTYKISSAKTNDAGSYTVTVSNSAGSVTSSAVTLTVNPVPVTLVSISISGSSSVEVSSTAQYTCTATYSDGSSKTVKPNWSVSPTTYATITSAGVLTGKAKGTATVKASYTDGVTKTATKSVTITKPDPIGNATISMVSKNAVTYASNCGELAGTRVGTNIWGAILYNGQEVARQAFAVSAKGTPTGTLRGNIITTDQVTAGATVEFQLAAFDQGYLDHPDEGNYYYGISEPFEYRTGNSSDISPDASLVFDSFTVEWVTPVPDLVSISISGSSSVEVGSTAQYTCTATYSDGSSKKVTPTWSVSPNTYATITSGGVLTGKAEGTVTVKASYTENGVTKTATKSVTITKPDPVPVSISISGSSSVEVDSTATYTCTAKYSDGTTKTVTPTWSVSPNTYATITSGGVLTGKAEGTVTVKAVYEDLTATKSVTITKPDPDLVSISISGSSSVEVGSTAQYTCTATYSDGSSKKVTPTWSVSPNTYATITSGGVLTGKAEGTVTVKASYTENGVTKTATKSVTIITKPDPNPGAFRSVSGNGKNSVTVTLKLQPDENVSVIFVDERVPAGVTISVNNGGTYTASHNMIRWSSLDGSLREVSYVLTVADDFVGKVSLSGEVTFDEETFPVKGIDEIEFPILTTHPADMNDDFEISTKEIASYALAWTKAQSWSREPADIPVLYVSRAAMIWVNGGYYTYDSSKNEPACWVSSTVKPASVELAADSSNVRKISVNGNKANVALTVEPASGISVYFVEERIPTGLGLSVSDISNKGTYVASQGLIRWACLDGEPQTLTYTIEPEEGFKGVISINGEVTFDEEIQVTSGDTEADFRDPIITYMLEGKTLILNFTGTLYESDDAVNWTEVEGAQSPFRVDITEGKKFYRCAQ